MKDEGKPKDVRAKGGGGRARGVSRNGSCNHTFPRFVLPLVRLIRGRIDATASRGAIS